MHKLKSLIYRLVRKGSPRLDPFEKMEKMLERERPMARESFKENLKGQLLARHQDIMEERLDNSSKQFYFQRFATVTAAVFLLVVVGGGGLMVSAATAPIPRTQTIGGLGAQIQPNVAPITVHFDQPMTKGSVEQAFSIYPPVEGHFVWDDRQTMHFLPQQELVAGVEYKVKVASSARSFFQKPLKIDYERTFETFLVNFSGDFPLDELNEMRRNFGQLSPEKQVIVRRKIQEMDRRLREMIQQGNIQFEGLPSGSIPPQSDPGASADSEAADSATTDTAVMGSSDDLGTADNTADSSAGANEPVSSVTPKPEETTSNEETTAAGTFVAEDSVNEEPHEEPVSSAGDSSEPSGTITPSSAGTSDDEKTSAAETSGTSASGTSSAGPSSDETSGTTAPSGTVAPSGTAGGPSSAGTSSAGPSSASGE